MKIPSYLPVFPGFYGTIFEPYAEEQELEHLRETTGVYYDYDDIEWDYKEYMNRIAQACVGAIEQYLKNDGLDIKITFEKLVSPREYNFKNDSINVEYSLNLETFFKLKDYAWSEDNLPKWEQYLKDRYASRSGFISFYSYNPDTWRLEYLKPGSDKFGHCFGTLLDFYLENEGYTSEDLYYDIDSETGYIEYKLPHEQD